MKFNTLFLVALLFSATTLFAQNKSAIDLSQDMMTSFKMNFPLTEYETQLSEISYQSLKDELSTNSKKQAFWLNVYIVYSQKLIAENEPNGCDKACKKIKSINIAGQMVSLNNILYGFLLHSKCPVTGGKKLIVPKIEKELGVNFPDGRVLLAIDSDSSISELTTYYEPEKIDQQLNKVSSIFISEFVDYNADRNEVTIPKWLKNFKREFGKKAGIYSGLHRAGVIPENTEPKIVYSEKIAKLQ